jgi:hypothetical protein
VVEPVAPVVVGVVDTGAPAAASVALGIRTVLPRTTCVSGERPFAAATVLGLIPFAAAIDQSVSPGWTVCGTDALAGALEASAANAASAVIRFVFRTASRGRVFLAPGGFARSRARSCRDAVL